jgi:drug/metabolite transporter (DMT)-like permease
VTVAALLLVAGAAVPTREMSIVLSAIIGAAWMKEGAGGRRLAGAAVVVLVGVACVALAR